MATAPKSSGSAFDRIWRRPFRTVLFRLLWVIVLGGMVLGGLAGCGGSDDPPPPTGPIATATAPSGAPGEIAGEQIPPATEVLAGDLVWTTAVETGTNAPTNEVAEFDVTSPAIYAAIPISAAPAGATVTAAWTYNDTAIQGMDATVQLPEVRSEPIWVEFHLQRQGADDWPDGVYAITIREGERVVASGTVDVVPA